MTPLKHKLPTPPLAPGLPLLGNALDLLRDPAALMLRLYHEMGPVFRVKGGGREYTILAGLEANRWFTKNADDHMVSQPVYQPYIDDLGSAHVLVAMDGAPHRTYRKTLRPGYSREMIAPRMGDMVTAIEEAIAGWDAGESLNVTDLTQFLMAQVMGIAVAGSPIDGHFSDMKRFGKIMLGAGVGGFVQSMRALPGYRASRRRMIGFLNDNIDQHRANPPGDGRHADLIDTLLGAQRPNDGESLDEADLLAHAHTPYTNSLVYMSAACGFLLYRLIKHPDALAKVQPEIDALFADGPPAINALRGARWFRAAYMESMRLHPIALSTPRVVTEPFDFAQHRIEAGTVTLTSTAVCHYLPELFPDPETFDLTRFMPPRSEHRQAGAFVPFGLDAHVCLAAGIVEAVVMLTVGKLLHMYRFDLDSLDYELGLSVAPFPAPPTSFTVHVADKRSPEAAAHGDLLGAFLPDVDREELAAISERITTQTFLAGERIIREGDEADAFYIISQGHVTVSREEAGTLAELGPGDYFGEIGLLYGMPRSASVDAIDEVEAIVIDVETFTELVATFDLTSNEIARLMRRRLMTTTVATALPGLSVDEISAWLPDCEIETYAPGAVIIREGDPADRFYIIIRGQVEVINTAPTGEDIHLAYLGGGDYVGEIGLLRSQTRTATVRAVGDVPVDVVAITREAFAAMVGTSDEVQSGMGMQMIERLIDQIEARE